MFKLFGYDPSHYIHHIPDEVFFFNNRDDLILFLNNWLIEHLEYQKDYQSKFYKDINYHLKKYLDYFRENSKIYYFGEYHNPSDIDIENPPLYIWTLE